MKKLIGLVVILAVLILGGYYGTGLITERTIKRDVNLINQSEGLYLHILQYDRGWFTSTAKLSWRLHVPERLVKNQAGQTTTVPAQDYTLDMPLAIYHGPVIFADSSVKFGLGYAHSDLTIPPAYEAQFASLFTAESTKPELKLSILVNYLNQSSLRAELPAFTLIAKDGGQVQWLGMSQETSISSNLDRISGSFTIDGMIFIKDKVHATVGKITTEYDVHQTSDGLYLGDASFSFPSLVVTDNKEKIYELEKLELQTSSDIDSGLISSHFKASLEKMIANGKSYGPGLFKISLENLDAKVLANINEQATKMQQGSDKERQQALLMLLPEVPKLLSKGAKLEISELSFVMPEGELKGNLLVSLPKGEMGNPFELIQKIQGNGKLKIPAIVLKEIVRQSTKQRLRKDGLQQAMVQQMQNNAQAATTDAPESTQSEGSQVTAPDLDQQAAQLADKKVADMVQSGLLVKQGDDYVVEFNLAEGQLSVNGHPFHGGMLSF